MDNKDILLVWGAPSFLGCERGSQTWTEQIATQAHREDQRPQPITKAPQR
jgi:hypothetical protein